MFEINSTASIGTRASSIAAKKQVAPTRSSHSAEPQISSEIQPFPSWARLPTRFADGPNAAADAAFAAGASLAQLDQIPRVLLGEWRKRGTRYPSISMRQCSM